jgi:hypothetical protein
MKPVCTVLGGAYVSLRTTAAYFGAKPMTTRLLRLDEIYGRGGRLPVGKTSFFEHYAFQEGGPGVQCVTGTTVPKLRLMRIAPRVVVATADEVDALVEALRAARDAGDTGTRRKLSKQFHEAAA